MQEEISFQKVQSDNVDVIELIANWYLKEWSIPIERTHQRLTNTPNNDVIFQLILLKDCEPIATGGLYNKVGLLNVYPKLRKFHPWFALLYTDHKYRNRGYGNKLLKKIEEISKAMGYNVIYLHTFSAERLYLKNNWEPFDKIPYKGKVTVVMKKKI
jgi:GNAT superfamily N-acetyltransferase